jgi:hypothetical protein
MSTEDPLLSVSQIARLWGTGLDVVVGLVESKTLPSLDRGELISRGHLDIPLIRESWAEFMRRGGEATGRILRPPDGESEHPALRVALAVHSALGAFDADGLWALSSKRSREGRDAAALLARWTELNRGGYPEDSGVGSTIYSLAPLPAVAARVFAQAPRTPRAMLKATPALLIAVLPLIWEESEWRVDLPLYAGDVGDVFLPDLLTRPLPDGAILDPSRPEDSDPPQSPPPTT